MQDKDEKRSSRVSLLKKLIIAFLILGILIPIILCILLFIKVGKLQKQVDELTEAKMIYQQMQKTASTQKSNPDVEFGSIEQADSLHSAAELRDEVADAAKQPKLAREDATKVYLTFDDGPSSQTDAILDILKEYDVKATFFVIAREEEELAGAYNRIVEEGHTLGMHSYSHKYREIYASKDAFWQDVLSLQNFLYEKTGVWSHYYRFPGGSSNHVSKLDMKELASEMLAQDISYLDWNVSSQDASESHLSAQMIANNVMSGVAGKTDAVVLLHDTGDKKSTVEALPIILESLTSMENVEILPVSDDMEFIRHLEVQ